MSVSLLNIGSRSLAAAQGSLGTIAHNIANANTAGYSRQEAVLATSSGNYTGVGFFGRGVDITTVRRQYDQFLVASVQTNTAQAASATARAGALAELDSVFADAELGIGAAIDAMFAATSDLANRPGDASARQAFISRAGQLAERLGGVGAQLASMGTLADQRLQQAATQANQRLGEINSLNARIAQAQTTGQAPNDLLDQRDRALQQLNGLMAVSVVPVADGTVNLFSADGAALLVGTHQGKFEAVPDPADGARTSLQLNVGGVAHPLDAASLGGGSMAGLLRFRDDDLASAVNQVGRLAQVIAERFNAQQANGVDATGAAGVALFQVAAPVTHAHAANQGSGGVAVAVTDSGALTASDYSVAWDGSNYTVTRMSDGQASVFASFPATVDGLAFSGSGTATAGDAWLVRPFAAASVGLQARPLAPRQLATGFAVTVESAATNKGNASVRQFAVSAQGAATPSPVTITFNDPPTSFNVTGLSGGPLSNVPYTPGQQVPPAPATYNGWSVVLDGSAVAGDSFAVKPTTSPGTDNRNALAMGALSQFKLVGGATLNESYAALIGDVGTRVQGARDTAAVTATLQSESVSRQQQLSGVNLDEEAANLLRYQQAYQASAKLIQASQTLFEALLGATSR